MNKRGAYQKKARNIDNLRARRDLLVSALNSSVTLPKAVLPALAGQRSFAALSIPKLKINAMALNTMKSLAAEVFVEPDGNGDKGFAYLDSLRAQLKGRLEGKRANRSIEAKVGRAEEKLSQMSMRLQVAELQSVRRSRAYFDLYSKVNALVKEGALEEATRLRLFNLLDSHHATFGRLFDPNSPEGSEHSVVVPLHSRMGC
jgi:hypothetical protein